jgi:hypothetical protein
MIRKIVLVTAFRSCVGSLVCYFAHPRYLWRYVNCSISVAVCGWYTDI